MRRFFATLLTLIYPRSWLCCYCAQELMPGHDICRFHLQHHPAFKNWAQENRIYNDFLMRQKAWTPLPREERLKNDWDEDLYEDILEEANERPDTQPESTEVPSGQ